MARGESTEVLEIAERVLGGGTFSVEKFVECFRVLVEAVGGIEALRSLVLEQACRGSLVDHRRAEGTGADCIHPGSPLVEGPFPLPSQWVWAAGVSVFDFVTSGSRGWAEYYSESGPIFLRIGNLDYGTHALDLSSIQRVKPPANAEGTRTRVQAGDILISITGDTGMVGLVPESLGEAYINQHIALTRPSSRVLPAYLATILRAPSLLGRLQSAQRGIKNSLGLDDIRELQFPLPPLVEQKRIVARVDQLMALIDQLEAKQNRKRDLGARFTKASLEALTTAESPQEFTTAWTRILEDWETHFRGEEDVADLRSLCLWMGLTGRIGASSVEHPAWNATTLGQVSSFVTSGSRGWKEYYASTGSIFVRSQDIKTDNLDLSDPAYVALPQGVEGSRTRVQRDDLLVTITGANVGKAAHVRNDLPEAYVSQHVALIRLKEPRFAPWVHYWLVSPHNGRKTLSGFAYGDKPGLNLDNIRCLPILLPPLAEQKRIVAKVEHLMKLCDALEAALRRSEDRAAKLVEAVVQEMVA